MTAMIAVMMAVMKVDSVNISSAALMIDSMVVRMAVSMADL